MADDELRGMVVDNKVLMYQVESNQITGSGLFYVRSFEGFCGP